MDFLNIHKYLDENAQKLESKEIVGEIILPNVPEIWYKSLVKSGTKSAIPLKEAQLALENCEENECKFNKVNSIKSNQITKEYIQNRSA